MRAEQCAMNVVVSEQLWSLHGTGNQNGKGLLTLGRVHVWCVLMDEMYDANASLDNFTNINQLCTS